MKTIVNFDINHKPKGCVDKIAYLVDKSNVDLMRKYAIKHSQHLDVPTFVSSWTDWFDKYIGDHIASNPNNKSILYFDSNSLCYDDEDDAVAYYDGYDIYYIQGPKQLMKVE